MPWKECNVVEEGLRFIARHLDGEKMAGLCREFGIARKTGYKVSNSLDSRLATPVSRQRLHDIL